MVIINALWWLRIEQVMKSVCNKCPCMVPIGLSQGTVATNACAGNFHCGLTVGGIEVVHYQRLGSQLQDMFQLI